MKKIVHIDESHKVSIQSSNKILFAPGLGIMAHPFNTSTQETEVDGAV